MIEINRITLPNGLRVVHSRAPQTAMVAMNVLYDTGARDESPGLTGMAHLFEHLMFGGSVNIPSYDNEIEAAGGVDNAWTSNDFTNFYDVVPAQNIETLFHLESDRMLGLSFSDRALEVQRQVVIEEFKERCLNTPYGDTFHHLRPLLYGTHPYSWPVIGKEPDHIARVTNDDVREWFYAHYAPDNAVVSVVGNVSFNRVRELAIRWFGDIPRRKVARRHIGDVHPISGPLTKEVRGDVPQTAITIAFLMDPYGTRGYIAADAITDILAAGRSARFFRNLVMGTSMFSEADASISGNEHNGFLMLNGRLNDGSDGTVHSAIAAMMAEARRIATPGEVTAYELERIRNRYESDFTFSNMNYVSKAQTLAMAEYHGEDINDTVSRYRSISSDEITKVANDIFINSFPVTLIYRPEK